MELLDSYVGFCISIGIDMRGGNLFFRLVNGQKAPYTPTQMTNKLKGYLRVLGMKEDGSTMHSFRAGGAVTKILEGMDLEQVMLEAYWKTEATANRYLGMAEVLNPFSVPVGDMTPSKYM